MIGLQGILTPEQREMGFNLTEDDHLVYLHKGMDFLAALPATSVTFVEIQREAHNHEQWIKSGIEGVN